MNLFRCSSCGSCVYEYGPHSHGTERVVRALTGCTTYSCYGCGHRGWLRKGRSNHWIAIMAKNVQVMLPILIILAVVIIALGILIR